jgi:glycosyltransferase involved in cell wall biosynthesis
MSTVGRAPEPAPLISVVIPAYKRPELLRKAVLALFDQVLSKDQYEVIVVDSSPDDRNTAVLAELQQAAPCPLGWFTKKPEGPGPSRSLGVDHARGEFIAFTDSDCQPARDWLRNGLSAFADGVGLVQGRTMPDPAARRGVLSWYVSVDRENFVYECCNIFYRRDALLQAGPLRASHFPTSDHPPGGEDVDIAWRVKRNGWRSRFASQAVVYHEVVTIPMRRWLVNEQLFIWPFLVRQFPELREFFYRRYFFDKAQAYFIVAVVGLLLAVVHPAWLALVVPYALLRGLQPTATLRGLLRPLRVPTYFARDAASFVVLLVGCLRFRSVLL